MKCFHFFFEGSVKNKLFSEKPVTVLSQSGTYLQERAWCILSASNLFLSDTFVFSSM